MLHPFSSLILIRLSIALGFVGKAWEKLNSCRALVSAVSLVAPTSAAPAHAPNAAFCMWLQSSHLLRPQLSSCCCKHKAWGHFQDGTLMLFPFLSSLFWCPFANSAPVVSR